MLLLRRGGLVPRRDGNRVLYSLADTSIFNLAGLATADRRGPAAAVERVVRRYFGDATPWRLSRGPS